MANSQLIAYASAQLDKGVTREVVAQALVGAGWQQADVEAALAEVMAQRAAAPAATLNVSPVAGPETTVASAVQPVVSAPADVMEAASPAAATAPATIAPVTPSFFATTPSMSMDAVAEPKRSMSWLIVLLGIVLALAIVGAVAYVLMSGSSAAPASSNPDELATIQQERDQLQATVTSLTENQTKLENELAFFAATTTTSVTSTVSGRLSVTAAGAWILTTPHEIVITVSNAKDAPVADALPPFKDADVSLTGTHAPGSTLLRVTAINGTAIEAAAPASASTTASTTPPGTR